MLVRFNLKTDLHAEICKIRSQIEPRQYHFYYRLFSSSSQLIIFSCENILNLLIDLIMTNIISFLFSILKTNQQTLGRKSAIKVSIWHFHSHGTHTGQFWLFWYFGVICRFKLLHEYVLFLVILLCYTNFKVIRQKVWDKRWMRSDMISGVQLGMHISYSFTFIFFYFIFILIIDEKI